MVAIKEMGGPDIKWTGGRTDFVDDSKLPPQGRLPDGAQGSEHLRHVFGRMGFSDQEIVALSGAHNLGRCHSDRSGTFRSLNGLQVITNTACRLGISLCCFSIRAPTDCALSGFHGAWVNNPTRFSNQYFKLLMGLEWQKKKFPSGVEQYMNYDEDLDTELMMLPTDMALKFDPHFSAYVKKYADNVDTFFKDFAAVFAKLLELGIRRDADGKITNVDNEKGGYHAAPKKKQVPGATDRMTDDKVEGDEARPLAKQNHAFQAKL